MFWASSWSKIRPREEPYGRVAVFLDVAGNRWDLLGPAAELAQS
jgi:hypothetical protein